jgi:hypothetical protein
MIIMILVGGYIRAGKKSEMVMAWWLEGSQLTVHHGATKCNMPDLCIYVMRCRKGCLFHLHDH